MYPKIEKATSDSPSSGDIPPISTEGQPQHQSAQPANEHPRATNDNQRIMQQMLAWIRYKLAEPTLAEWLVAMFTLALVITSLLQWSVITEQLNQMKVAAETATESTALLRQQLIGTQAASVALRLDVFGSDGLRVWFARRGVVAARSVWFEFYAVRKEIHTLEDIEPWIQRVAYLDELGRVPYHY